MARATTAAPPKRSEARQQLAWAIESARNADKNLNDAKAAVETAFQNWQRADHELDALLSEQEAAAKGSPDELISTLAGGGDLLELTRPATALREKIEAKRAELESWENAQTVAKRVIPARQSTLDVARLGVANAAKAVVVSEVDPSTLIKEVEDLQATLSDKSRLLQAIANQFPAERRREIELTLARNSSEVHASSDAFLAYVEALKSNPDAKLS
jgi:hypothetical protein